MKEILGQLFKFLQENRTYNKTLQEKYYRSVIKPYDNVSDKVVSLLYHIANTQSQPKIDCLSKFYKDIYENIDCLNSFESFINKIRKDNSTEINYKGLFESLENQPGFGVKTSALFTKSIFHLHNGQYPNKLKIWNDVPKIIGENDQLYLPVDSVIIAIFNKINKNKIWNFKSINKEIKLYNSQDIEVWDDLWFWGFITQNGSGENRTFQWNGNKYWTIKETDKDPLKIEEIKYKAEIFLQIFENN